MQLSNVLFGMSFCVCLTPSSPSAPTIILNQKVKLKWCTGRLRCNYALSLVIGPKHWLDCIARENIAIPQAITLLCKSTLFQVLYCNPLPRLLSYPIDTKLEETDYELQNRDYFFWVGWGGVGTLRDGLLHAKAVMKRFYDSQHQEVHFNIGNQVLLKLHPYYQIFLAFKQFRKLAPKFYGHFSIPAKIDWASYKLNLPPSDCIHLSSTCLFWTRFTRQTVEPSLPPVHLGEIVWVCRLF